MALNTNGDGDIMIYNKNINLYLIMNPQVTRIFSLVKNGQKVLIIIL